MRIIAFVNQKGGVGKTTSCLNIGAGLTKLGKKTLLIDLDPQSNLTVGMGIKDKDIGKTIYEVLKGEISASSGLVRVRKIDIMPSNIALAGAEFDLLSVPGREKLLSEALTDIKKYDYLLIDCPPSLGLLTLNGLVATKEVFIPVQTEFFPLLGMNRLLDTINLVKKRLNPSLEVTGVIATMYDGRRNLHKEVLQTIKNQFKGKVFNTIIHSNVSLAESPSFGKDIFDYSPHSRGAGDYLELTKEIIKRGTKQ